MILWKVSINRLNEYARFDNFDSMKSWTIDINNEANSNTPVSERYDWWNEIYDQVGF